MKWEIKAGLLALLLCGVWAVLHPAMAAEFTPRILLLLSGDTEVHLKTMRGFKERLDEYGSITAILDVKKLGDAERADEISLSNPGSDLVLAIGTRATRMAAEADVGIPMLSIVVPKITFNGLMDSSVSVKKRHEAGKFSGIVLDQPPLRRMRLARILLPDLSRIGLLLGPTSQLEADEYVSAAKQADVQLNISAVGSDTNPIPAIEALLKGNDALLAVYDSVALNPSTAKWLLYLSYQNRIPVIGFSRAYVDAGALAAVYSTPEQIGRQAAEVVYDFVNGKSGSLPLQVYPKYYSIGLNSSVARSIGLSLPDEESLQRQLKQLEPSGPVQ